MEFVLSSRRYFYITGIFFLLALQQTQGAIQSSCTTNTVTWMISFSAYYPDLKTCVPNIEKVDDEDFTISTETDPSILGFGVQYKENVKFLPKNLGNTFPELIAFQVCNCSVTWINEYHFKGLSKLRALDLSHNKIGNIASGAFADLVSIQYLYMYNNRIRSLGENTFVSLKALKEISLDSNDIRYLSPKIFSESLANLTRIYLSKNKLERIPKDFFKNNLNLTETLT